MLNKNVILNKIVILSEAKNLKLRRGTILEILRFAQNDIFPAKDLPWSNQ